MAQPVADQFLRELRFGRDRAESTSKAYAEGVSLFLRWCLATERDWRTAAGHLGLFITWLKYQPTSGSRVIPGPGAKPVRSVGRINRVLVAVRGFLSFAVVAKELPQVLDGVEFGTTRRQRQKGDVVGDRQLLGRVPAGLIEEEHGVGTGSHGP